MKFRIGLRTGPSIISGDTVIGLRKFAKYVVGSQ